MLPHLSPAPPLAPSSATPVHSPLSSKSDFPKLNSDYDDIKAFQWPSTVVRRKSKEGMNPGPLLKPYHALVILLQLHRASFCFSNSQASFPYEGLCTDCFLLPGKCPFLHLCLANSSLSEFAYHHLREAFCNYSILPSPCIPLFDLLTQ